MRQPSQPSRQALKFFVLFLKDFLRCQLCASELLIAFGIGNLYIYLHPPHKIPNLHHRCKVTLQWKKKFAVKNLFHCKLFFSLQGFVVHCKVLVFFTAKSFCSAANFWHFKKGFRLFHCKVSVFSLQGFLVPLQSFGRAGIRKFAVVRISASSL